MSNAKVPRSFSCVLFPSWIFSEDKAVDNSHTKKQRAKGLQRQTVPDTSYFSENQYEGMYKLLL